MFCKLVFVFPFQIYNKVKTGDQLKVEHVVSVLEKQYPYVEVNSVLGIDSAYDQNRKVRIHELKHLPLFCFNTVGIYGHIQFLDAAFLLSTYLFHYHIRVTLHNAVGIYVQHKALYYISSMHHML